MDRTGENEAVGYKVVRIDVRVATRNLPKKKRPADGRLSPAPLVFIVIIRFVFVLLVVFV